jgi:hypothetical protein
MTSAGSLLLGKSNDPVVAQAMAAAGRRLAELAGRDDPVVLVDEPVPHIPPGTYDAVGFNAEIAHFRHYGREKLSVTWQVLVPDPEEDCGRRIVLLARHYNIERRKKGYHASRGTDLMREWMLVTNRRPRRGERASGRAFVKVLCTVEVGTVEKDGRGRPLPDVARYSVVRRVVAVGPCAPPANGKCTSGVGFPDGAVGQGQGTGLGVGRVQVKAEAEVEAKAEEVQAA